MSKEQEVGTSRRQFLKLAGTAAPAAVAVTALSGTDAKAADLPANKTSIQDTAHTRAYLDSARF